MKVQSSDALRLVKLCGVVYFEAFNVYYYIVTCNVFKSNELFFCNMNV